MKENNPIDIILKEESWLSDRLQELEKIEDSIFQAICLYSLFESYAQEYCNYEKRAFVAFRKYIVDFSTDEENNFLGEYDPVSIYYEYQDVLGKEHDLSFMDSLGGTSPNANIVIETRIANKMIQKLCSLEKVKSMESLKYHTFMGLLYGQRNKLSHEHYSSSMSLRYNSLKEQMDPCYHNVIYGNCKPDKNLISTIGIWQFDFPLGYLKKLLCVCAINYHAYRRENKERGGEMRIPWTQKKDIPFKYKKIK